VLILRKNDLKNAAIRGICLAEFPLPVIIFRNEAPAGQAFTLAHEFAHVLIKHSAISGPRQSSYEQIPVEKWCDRFAAAFLMPRGQLVALLGGPPTRGADFFPDEELLRLAAMFRVSAHAMLIRLVHIGYVQAAYYWDVKKPEFDKQERSYRSFGRTRYYGQRYGSSLGEMYTGLVIEAWNGGRITSHNAAEYMGIKNLRHMYDIRENRDIP
jgi:Zn-dependent peptidase ImmA (M78 family)